MPGDYDGDGKCDLAVYDPSTYKWFVISLDEMDGGEMIHNGVLLGAQNAVPVAGDYDGDGIDDLAVYITNDGFQSEWIIRLSSTGVETSEFYGWNEATPYPGDYDGDGVTDIAVWNEDQGWFINISTPLSYLEVGGVGYVPAPFDYDRDGKCDLAMYNQDEESWCIRTMGTTITTQVVSFGKSGTVPLTYRNSMHSLIKTFVCEPDGNTTPSAPEWIKELIIYRLDIRNFNRIENGMLDGTFESARDKLDYLQDLGITGVILSPITEYIKFKQDIAYGVYNHDKLDPALGSANDYASASAEFLQFVIDAHTRGIKVIIDVVPHGVGPHNYSAEKVHSETNKLVLAHPKDWWIRDLREDDPSSKPLEVWDELYEFDFTNPDVKRYWITNSLMWVETFDIDGFRCDLEPGTSAEFWRPSGYHMWKDVINESRLNLGKELVIISEEPHANRNYCYHMSEHDFAIMDGHNPPDFFNPTNAASVIGVISQKEETYYSSRWGSYIMDSSKGYQKNCLAYFGYGMLISPFIPGWTMGKEFNGWVPDQPVYDIQTISGEILGNLVGWGIPGDIIPMSGDYNGDKTNDMAIYHILSSEWYIKDLSGSNILWKCNWGWSGVTPVPGDYDGDGIDDMAIFDQTTGRWFIRAVDGTNLGWNINWGWQGVLPVSGDFNGDGADDLAIFDDATGRWFIRTLSGTTIAWDVDWGWPGVTPVPGDFDGDGADDLAIFDQSTGRWFIRNIARDILAWSVYWGHQGVTPLSGNYDDNTNSCDLVYCEKIGDTWSWSVAALGVNNNPIIILSNHVFGIKSSIPISCDYNNDGTNDFVVCDTNKIDSYWNFINWTNMEVASNSNFFYSVKRLIQIRKDHRDIIAPFCHSLRDTSIIDVKTDAGNTDLQSYAMYSNDVAIIVIGKTDLCDSGMVTYYVPIVGMEMDESSSYWVTPLLHDATGGGILYLGYELITGQSINVNSGDLRVLKIEKNL